MILKRYQNDTLAVIKAFFDALDTKSPTEAYESVTSQANTKTAEVPVEVLKAFLTDTAKLPASEIAVVTGERLRNAKDTLEKDAIGRLWAAKSGGKCLYATVYKSEAGLDVKGQLDKLFSSNF